MNKRWHPVRVHWPDSTSDQVEVWGNASEDVIETAQQHFDGSAHPAASKIEYLDNNGDKRGLTR